MLETVKFESWGDYLNYLQQYPTAALSRRSDPVSLRVESASAFTGAPTWLDATKLATEGWLEGEAKARAISNALFGRIGSLVERDEELYDVEGQGVDISLYNQNIPECWVRTEQHFAEAPGPIVKIVFNITISGGISKDVIVSRGAAIAGLVECIELSGKSTELWTVWTAAGRFGGKSDFEVRVKVKEAGQALDMGRVMFATAHPAAIRRLAFRALELSDHNFLVNENYGFPADTQGDKGDIYIASGMLGEPQWENPQAATAWVIDQLRKQNITVNDQTQPQAG